MKTPSAVTDVTFVLVHYYTPGDLLEAVASIRREHESAGLTASVLVVDNGSDEGDRDRLRQAADRYLLSERNLGYAGALNRAMRQVESPIVVVLNPDVCLLPASLESLLDALGSSPKIVGPKSFWDSHCRLLQPPTEPVSRIYELLAALATRSSPWAKVARRRWRRHARRHWLSTEPLASTALSGSLLAFHRTLYDMVGPFDEGFRLYFEETDWLQRARSLGLDTLYVPAATVWHRYSQSAHLEPEAPRWFRASASRFRRRYYGELFSRLLEHLARQVSWPSTLKTAAELELPAGAQSEWWLEVSPRPIGFPAVGMPVHEHCGGDLAALLDRTLPRPGSYRLALSDGEGKEKAVSWLKVP